MKLAGAPTHPIAAIALQPQVIQVKLDDVLDSRNDGVPKHLGQIADSMYEWEGPVADELGLTQADVANIKTKYPNQMDLQALVMRYLLILVLHYFLIINRREALHKWKMKPDHKATYKNLAGAFIKAGHRDYADKVHEVIGKQLNASIVY